MQSRQLTATLTVSPQIDEADFAALARHGVHLVINNRPDGEVAGQIPAAIAAVFAATVGMQYRHIPVTFATLQASEIDHFALAVAEATGPVHAHCASGIRSATLWLLGRIQAGAMTRTEATNWATENGFDPRPALAWLDRNPKNETA